MEPDAPGHHRQPDRAAPPRRGLIAFACIAVGIVIADALPVMHPAWWFAAACGVAIVTAVAPRRHARPLLGLCVLLLGAGSMSARVLWTPADRLPLQGPTQLLVVRGTLLAPPQRERRDDQWEPPLRRATSSMRMPLALDQVQLGDAWHPVSGEMAVFVRGDELNLAAGARIEVTGRFRPVLGPVNPGEHDARRWAAQEGRVGTLTVENADGIIAVVEQPGLLVRLRARVSAFAHRFRGGALDALMRAVGPADDEQGEQSRALLRAMLIGDDDPTLRPVSDDMSRLGIVHILSISGFHLVLIASVVVFLIRLTGDRGVWEYALAAAAISLYLLIIPAQAPVVRSGVMVLALLLTEACGRRYDRLNVLAWTACALALWRPLDLYSPGFQLSFGVTAVLIWRAAAWNDAFASSGLLWMPGVKGRARREPDTLLTWLRTHLTGLCTATALAWCVSSAVVAFHVGVLSFSGVIAGVVLTLPSIAAIGAGFVAMLTAVVAPFAAGPLGALANLFSDLTVRGSHLAAQLPASALSLPQVPLTWTLAATTVAVAAVAPGGWRRGRTRVAALGCVGWLIAVMFAAAAPVTEPTIDRFALPESSASLIRAADQAVLIDPGSEAHKSGAFTLRRAVSACGAWKVRTVIITGPQTGRFAHLPELARALGVQTVLLPPGFEEVAVSRPGGDQDRLLKRLAAIGVQTRVLQPDEALSIGDLAIQAVGPGVINLTRPHHPPQSLTLSPIEQSLHAVIPP